MGMSWLLFVAVVDLSLICATAVPPVGVGLSLDKDAQLQEFTGVSRWHILPNLWVHKSVNITCSGTEEFHTYVAYSLEELKGKLARKETAWCGWQNLLLVRDSCVARLSPFGSAYVLVVPRRPRKGVQCTVTPSQSFSLLMLGQGVLGTMLYVFASPLSASMFFRLTTGSLGFMLLSVAIVLFILARTLPNKKSAAALVAAFGSSVLTGIRYFFGQWIPSFEQLIYNKMVLVYLAVSGVVGWAVTYYFDSEDNVKLHVILKHGLKLLGLLLLAFSTSMPEASVVLCCALVLGDAGWAIWLLFRQREAEKRAVREARIAAQEAAQEAAQVEAVSLLPSRPESSRVSQQPLSRPRTPAPAGFSAQGLSQRLKTALDAPFPGPSGTTSMTTTAPSTSLTTQRQESGSVGTPTGYDGRGGQSSGYGSGSQQHQQQQQESPLVRRGLIVNERTGKTIKIGAATYNKLLLEGYDVDVVHGIMTPPRNTSASSPSSRPSAPSSSVPSPSPSRRRSSRN